MIYKRFYGLTSNIEKYHEISSKCVTIVIFMLGATETHAAVFSYIKMNEFNNSEFHRIEPQ